MYAIRSYYGLDFIHGQHEAEAADAALVAQGLLQRLAQGQTHVFHRVVIVDMQIASYNFV